MAKLVSLGVLLIILQSYRSTDTSNVLLSEDTANSFLQANSRSRRDLQAGLRQECCFESCAYEERAEFSSYYGWEIVNLAICEVSIIEGRYCTCRAWQGFPYECGRHSCRRRLCGCLGVKNDKQWEVISVSYDIPKGSLSLHPVAAITKTVDNLNGEVAVETSFSITKEVTEEESFKHTAGTSLTVGTVFTVGVPIVNNLFGIQATISRSLTVSSEHTFGKKTTNKLSRTAVLQCPAPAHRYVRCEGMMKTVKMTVPYTMKLKHRHYGCNCTSYGVYKNLHHSNIYLKTYTYKSRPSGNETEDANFMEGQSQLVQD